MFSFKFGITSSLLSDALLSEGVSLFFADVVLESGIVKILFGDVTDDDLFDVF